MKKTLCAGALLVLMAMTAACSFKIFEDIGSDPHPPAIGVTALVLYVAPAEPATPTIDRAISSSQGRSIIWDSGGFTLSPGQKFQIGITYADAGGDIVKFPLRDRDGALRIDLVPIERTYFSGTSGSVLGSVDGIGLEGIVGPHRLELWAEDSHGSRSEKVEFVITLTL